MSYLFLRRNNAPGGVNDRENRHEGQQERFALYKEAEVRALLIVIGVYFGLANL